MMSLRLCGPRPLGRQGGERGRLRAVAGNGTPTPGLPPLPDFAAVNRAALPHLESLCRRWLPAGKRLGQEWTCGSVRGEAGASCKVSLRTGRWADFATGERGGDVVSLAAATHRIPQTEAARRLARMLGLGMEDRRRG